MTLREDPSNGITVDQAAHPNRRESAQQSSRKPWQRPYAGLLLIGIGLPEGKAVTAEAITALRHCKTIFISTGHTDFLRQFCRDVRIPDAAGGGGAGVEAVLALLKTGATVGYVTYGHPLIYHGPAAELFEECARRKIPVSVISGVSALDAVLSALTVPITTGHGMLVGDLRYLTAMDLQPRSHVIIYRPDEDKRLFGLFIRKCMSAFGTRHRLALVECGNGETIRDKISWLRLDQMAARFNSLTKQTTILIPPVLP